MDDLQKNQRAILNEATEKVFKLFGKTKALEDIDEDLIFDYDYKPDDADLNNFIPKLVINSKEISLWQKDKMGHSNSYYWRKSNFESLDDFISFKTSYNIHQMAVAKVFQILREGYYDTKTEESYVASQKKGFFKKLFKRNKYATSPAFEMLSKHSDKILNEIENDLIQRRQEFFQSDEFLELKVRFDKNRKLFE